MVAWYILRTSEGNMTFPDIDFRFATALDQILYTDQITDFSLHHTCEPISELPSNISTTLVKQNFIRSTEKKPRRVTECNNPGYLY